MIEGGDCFLRRRTRRASDGLPIPLQVQLYEADHLDVSKDEARGDAVIRQGIEYDHIGRRVAYWMFPEHPGDTGVSRSFTHRMESVRIPAGQVSHLFERQRVQSRGVPWGAAAMRAMRDFDDWSDAERLRKKLEACVVAIVSGADEDSQEQVAPTVVDAKGEIVEQFRPGMVAIARGGKKVDFNSPSAASGAAEWVRVQEHLIASGWRVPYELLTGDLSQVNYSSYRAGSIEFRRDVDAKQWQIVIPLVCQPIWDWFVEAGFLAGRWRVTRAKVEWEPPAFEEVDRLKEYAADLIEVRSGFTTLARQIGKRGYDIRSTLQERAEENAELDRLGLVLDSDPRKVTKAGGAQANDKSGDAEQDGRDGRALRDLPVHDLLRLTADVLERGHAEEPRRMNGH
jgi:lambda family phage portal protein